MLRRSVLIAMTSVILMSTAGVNAAEARKETTMAAQPFNLTIYHLEARRSERIVWACEELGLPYKLEYKRGNLAGSMQTIRELSPLMPVAPTVRVNDQIMVESGAILELIMARTGPGKLAPPVNSPDYPYHLQWMHFAEGSFASRVIADYRVVGIQGKQQPQVGRVRLVDSEAVLKFADDFLGKHAYFGGNDFSAADIMMLFPVNITESFNVVELTPYKNILAWREKVTSRPAHKKMIEVARPDGVPGSPKPLPKS